MRRFGQLGITAGVALALAVSAYGQQAISAKAGMIHYVEGDVYLDDQAVNAKFGQFPQAKANSVVKTVEGRAELLMTPGAFLRLAENSSVKIVSDKLSDARAEVLKGSALVEVLEANKDTKLSLIYKDAEVLIEKAGLYRIDEETQTLRVYSGEAVVRTPNGPVEVKGGKQLHLGGDFLAAKFDKEDLDSFARWSGRRSEYLSVANLSAARSASRSGFASNGYVFNPYYGIFSYIPGSGYLRSPYGYYFLSSADAMGLYLPYYWSGVVRPGGTGGGRGTGAGWDYPAAMRSGPSFGGGSYGGSNSSGGSSYGYTPSVSASSSASSPGAASSAGATRGGGDAVGRGGSGGGHGR